MTAAFSEIKLNCHRSLSTYRNYRSNANIRHKINELTEASAPFSRLSRNASTLQASTNIVMAKYMLTSKYIGFSTGFIPILPAAAVKIKPTAAKPSTTFRLKKCEEVISTNVRNKMDQRILLGPSRSSKKWVWTGSNGRIKGALIDGWHKYIELSQKVKS